MMWRFATEEPAFDPATMERAREIIDWSNRPYHALFLQWLRDQADIPIEPKSAHADLICANARANTLKEVRQHFINETERAHQALESEHGG